MQKLQGTLCKLSITLFINISKVIYVALYD